MTKGIRALAHCLTMRAWKAPRVTQWIPDQVRDDREKGL